ncbi:dihydrodipicolinate synthase family protein [Arenibacter troitsensis]|uniref:Dihydrodipicolinate synthase/N-acetylneuraminate lyase n=1 Tax=Arenibacter troitsensis TaxID=188872 RepID=A0A1X7I2Z5_9FLAO|nr:dihydrodipicolinate synthase family protein [Arenibacter troitsensis]SMG08742.1 Dihydrodipicolinate synthase/N-acetylneuraminate lyase [Arenibacter troitsensis]
MSAFLTYELKELLQGGLAIPANPTALTRDLKLDERRQRALSRYYLDAGSGGLAIGVHTSQFEIREVGLYQPVLELGKEEMDSFLNKSGKSVFRIAGVLGNTAQAVNEAGIASDLGYHAGLLGLAALKGKSNKELVAHCRAVAEVIPVIGFYLQTSVGGAVLDTEFWREFSKIENVVAIKMAPFNRYNTLDVVRGVVESGRAKDIALYTGNDDNIVADLLTEYKIPIEGKVIAKKIVGGLLGHWAVWNKKAVDLFERIKNASPSEALDLLSVGAGITDANAAFFDSRNGFKGSIAGIHEVLIRQGLLEGNYTINPKERLSPGQKEEIDRVYALYPELNDDVFVRENIDNWLR